MEAVGRPEYLDITYDMFMTSIKGEDAASARFSHWVREVEKDNAFGFEAVRNGPQTPRLSLVRTTGESLDVINMSSYNYLGYSYHPQVIAAAKEALDTYGLGAASSPAHSGTFAVHKQLEREIVDFIGLPNRGVSLFSSGYGVNTGVISALMRRRDYIVLDKSAHMSILEGAQLTGATVRYFEHNDVNELRGILAELAKLAGTRRQILVCTEGVFSGDGDCAPLKDIVGVAKEFGARVLVDEAHSFLVAGPHGRGVVEAEGVLQDVDLLVFTFSKALGGVGGAVVCTEDMARYINWYARCRMFSCAIDPAVTGGVLKALQLGRGSDGDERRVRIRKNVEYLLAKLKDKVNTGASTSWILPVIYGAESKTIPLLDFLQRNGVDGSVLQFPAVPMNESRIRLFVTSEHTSEHLDKVADVICRAAVQFDFSTTKGGTRGD